MTTIKAMTEDSMGASPFKRKSKWRKSLYEFTQSATMHGLNKITEDTPYTVRR